jgi:hypothetical protein
MSSKLKSNSKCDGSYTSRNEFVASKEIPLTLMMYQQLKGVIETARIRYRTVTNNNVVDIVTFLNRLRKGSKRFRKILSEGSADYIPHNIVKFADNVDIIIGLEDSKKINRFWNTHYLSNSTRTFLFKLYTNSLGYHTAVSHFVSNHSRNCTFCDVEGNQEINDETPIHLLYSCERISVLIDSIFKWVTDDNDFELSRKEYFCFFSRDDLTIEQNFILTFFVKTVLKFIWDCKQRFCLPVVNRCKTYLQQEIVCNCSVNSNFRQMFTSTGYNHLI